MSNSTQGENPDNTRADQQVGTGPNTPNEGIILENMVAALTAGITEQIENWEAQKAKLRLEADEKLRLAQEIETVQEQARNQVEAIAKAEGVPGVIQEIPQLALLRIPTDERVPEALFEARRNATAAALESTDPEVLVWAFAHTSPRYEGNESTYLSALTNADRQVKMAALRALAEAGNFYSMNRPSDDIIAQFYECLESSDSEIAVLAIMAFGLATDEWAEAILKKPDLALHEALAKKLPAYSMRDETQRAMVTKLLESPSARLRKAVLDSISLGEQDSLEAYEIVIALFDDPDAEVRQAAFYRIFNSGFSERGDTYFYLDTRTPQDIDNGIAKRDLAAQRKRAMLAKLESLLSQEENQGFKRILQQTVAMLKAEGVASMEKITPDSGGADTHAPAKAEEGGDQLEAIIQEIDKLLPVESEPVEEQKEEISLFSRVKKFVTGR